MNLELKTYDMDTFNKWLELFGVKSNEWNWRSIKRIRRRIKVDS
jgi:hypothetical protein